MFDSFYWNCVHLFFHCFLISKFISIYKLRVILEPCEDTSAKCAKLASKKNCKKNKMVMENCKASCGICGKLL